MEALGRGPKKILSENPNYPYRSENAKYPYRAQQSGSSGGGGGDFRLLSDAKDFILHVLRESEGVVYNDAAQNNSKEDKLKIWGNLSEGWRCDRDVAFASLKYEHVKARDLADAFRYSPRFLRTAIEVNGNVWMGLPEELVTEVAFARAIRHFDERLAGQVMHKIPHMRGDRDFWKKVIGSKLDSLFDFMEKEADAGILCDKELMVQACGDDPGNLSRLNPALLQNEEFVRLLLTTAPSFLPHLPLNTQLLFPDVVAEFFKPYSDRFGCDDLAKLGDTIAPDLFQNRRVVGAWFAAGGRFIVGRHPRRWMNDQSLLLLIAKNCSRRDAEMSFQYAGRDCLDNKEFMCKVVQYNPWLYLQAGPEVAHDFDLALMAFSKSKEFTEEHARDKRFEGFIEDFQRRIHSELKKNRVSVLSRLCGLSNPEDAVCASSLLDQGCAVSLVDSYSAFVECFDVPSAKQLRLLRRAAANLSAALGSVAPDTDTESVERKPWYEDDESTDGIVASSSDEDEEEQALSEHPVPREVCFATFPTC